MQVLKKATRDVVRVRDVSSLIDISKVQQYVCNGYKVVYLKKWSGNKGSVFRAKLRYLMMPACAGCRRRLKSAYRFCSIGCKHVGACFFSFQKTVMVISLVIISLNRCYVASNCNSHGTGRWAAKVHTQAGGCR